MCLCLTCVRVCVCMCVFVCVWKTYSSPDADLPGRTLGQLAAPDGGGFAGRVAEVLAHFFLPSSRAAGHLSVPHPLPTSHQTLGEEGGFGVMLEKKMWFILKCEYVLTTRLHFYPVSAIRGEQHWWKASKYCTCVQFWGTFTLLENDL